MDLQQLATAIGVVPLHGADDVVREGRGSTVIVDVTHDSRQVVSGSLFCCVPGGRHDGHDHAAAAVEMGAVALLCERPLDASVPQLVVDDVRTSMSLAASLVWGSPSSTLKVIGVTGTNGKTTVVSFITAILNSAGVDTRMIGTLTGERTTPESTDLQRLLAGFVDDGTEAVAMEVSSHALVQHRVDDVEFDLAVFTNLGHDHLDFHGTQEAYFAAKSLLFEPRSTKAAVVNVDDIHGRLLYDAKAVPTTPVSLSDVADLKYTSDGSRFSWRGRTIDLPMVGRHNVSNAIVAASACVEIGLTVDQVVEGLMATTQVPGRFEIVDPTDRRDDMDEVIAVVDYAHTPDALESVLDAAREVVGKNSRVIVVFGCGGDRDIAKRPEMGEVAAERADVVVVTSDNPRSEDPMAIIDAIVAGVPDGQDLVVEPDRRRAIEAGLHIAGRGDIVVVAGKGHETGQTIGSRTEPFDDRVVVAELLTSEAGL